MIKSSRSVTRLSILALAIAVTLLWGGIWRTLQTQREDSLQSAAIDARNLARSVAEQEAASIRSIDLLVRYLRDEWTRDPASFPTTMDRHREFLEAYGILQITTVDANGIVTYSNTPGWKPVDLSDRPHFKIHKERQSDEIFISSPVLGRVSKQWTIQFTRPMFGKDGQFAGVLVASIPPPALMRNYKDVDLGEGSVVTLVRFDGQVMGRSIDFDKAITVSLAGNPGLRPEEPPTGEYLRASPIDRVERMFRYQKVASYPFTVFVGQELDRVLEPYHRLRTTYLAVGGIATALMIAVCLLIIARARKGDEAQRSQERFQAALRQSEERFRLIAETIDTVVWSADMATGGGLYVSPSYERVWGRPTPGEICGPHPLAEHAVAEDAARIAADFDLEKASGPFEHEYRIERPDGEVRWIWGRGFPVIGEDGGITRFVGVAQDITELKRSQEEIEALNQGLERRVEQRTAELQAANARLLEEKEQNRALIGRLEDAQGQLLQSEKMASVGQLAAGVAHEINNPVGFVNSNLGTLKTYFDDILHLLQAYEQCEPGLSDEQRAAVAQVRKRIDFDYLLDDLDKLYAESMEGLQRVKRIVQDLKDFSHVGDTEMSWVDLEKGIESTINVAWNELKYKADVVREYGGIPAVRCIPSQLNQVFMNLLVNAAQAIKERGRITVRTGEREREVWIEVEDTGSGISPENLKRIFEPFFTTKPVGKGTGLGLSLSYGIVQKHGGRIEVDSRPGEGSTFRVILPKAES